MNCKIFCMSAISTFALTPTVGWAQTTATDPNASRQQASAAQAATSGVEDIVVTATRRSERMQVVPVAVTALTSAALERTGVRELPDLLRQVPSLSLTGSSGGRGTDLTFSIRGQRAGDSFLTVDPAVGLYIAEVPQARSYGTAVSSFLDVARVEVLKGPQGTLFGRNTTGGAILVVPNIPEDTLKGSVFGQIGNYNQRRVEAMLNLPLTDHIGFRIAAVSSSHGGYVTNSTQANDGYDQDYYGFRASLRFTAGNLTSTFYSDYTKSKDHGTPSRITAISPTCGLNNNATCLVNRYPVGIGGALVAAYQEQQKHDFWWVASTDPNYSRSKVFGLSNTTEYQISDALLIKNILGYRRTTQSSNPDTDGTPLPALVTVFGGNMRQWSNELQLQANFDRFNLIFGGFYFDERGRDGSVVAQLVGILPSEATRYDGYVINRSKSLFAQGSYKITDQIKLTLGLRQTWDSRSLLSSNRTSVSNTCLLTDSAGARLNPCQRLVAKDFKATTYNISLDYRPTENILLYATTRRGYRSGGFNIRAFTPSEFTPFDPENVTDYELGFKGDQKIGGVDTRLNIAAWQSNYNDAIRRNSICLDASCNRLVVVFNNAAAAVLKGIEVEYTVSPSTQFTVRGFYSYTSAHYKSWTSVGTGGIVQDFSNNPLVNVPKHKFGITGSYDFPLTTTSSLSATASVYHQTREELNDVHSPGSDSPRYTLVDARLSWRSFRPGATLSVWGKNLTKAEYLSSTTNLYASLGMATGTIGGAPRTYGMDLKVDF